MTYEEILKETDDVERFGLLTEFQDELKDEIRVTTSCALTQIRKEQGDDFTGRFKHTDGRNYEVRTTKVYPNIKAYDKEGVLKALEATRTSLSKLLEKNSEDIRKAKESIAKEHPKMHSMNKRTLVLIREKKNRKEAQNESK